MYIDSACICLHCTEETVVQAFAKSGTVLLYCKPQQERILVGMPFIHYNKLEMCQGPGELGVHGQDAPVQHVWVGNQQLRSLTRFTTVSLQGSHVRTRSKARGRGGGGPEGGIKAMWACQLHELCRAA